TIFSLKILFYSSLKLRKVNQQGNSYNYPVPTPGLETVLRKDTNKELNRNYSYNKGYKISHEEARGILRIREDHFVTLLLHAVVVPLLQENRIGSYGKHGGNRQKERKFSSGHAGKF